MSEENQGGQLFVAQSVSNNLPSMVRNELATLPSQKQEEFVEEFNRNKKSLGVGYLLLILGLHYGYFGNWGLLILFILTGGGLGVWLLIDLFRLPSMIKQHNKDTSMDIMRNLKAVSS